MRYVHADQIWVWGLFCFLGMYLNVNLATYIVPHGTDLQGLAAGSYQAKYLAEKIWPGFWFLTLFNGFWILFKTQLGNTDILVRTVTDCAWMASRRARAVDGRDPGHLLRDPALVLVVGGPGHPVGVAFPALHHPRQRRGPGPGHRRRPDLHRQPPLPAAGRAPGSLARAGPPGLRGLLRVLLVLRDPRPRALPSDLGRPMKALVYVGPETMEMQTLPDPSVGQGEVLLEISAAGICGSDIHGFLGHSERRKPGLVMGHETVARIAEVHPTVKGWRVSERVSFNPLVSCRSCPACLEGRQNVCADWKLFGMDRLHGTYAEYVSVPACQLLSLSESLPEPEAILVEPLAVVIHAFRVSMAETPRTMAIFGAGPIGALALVLAKLRGVPRVCVVDVNARAPGGGADPGGRPRGRRRAARRPGGGALLDGGRGAEHVVEAVGVEATRRAAVAASSKGGRILFLGLAQNDSALPWIEMTRNEQAVFTSFAYTPRDFEAAVRLVEARRFDLKPWTETRPLAEGQASFVKMARDPGATLKLMLTV